MLNRLLTGLALTVSLLFGAPRALAGDDAPAAFIARDDKRNADDHAAKRSSFSVHRPCAARAFM